METLASYSKVKKDSFLEKISRSHVLITNISMALMALVLIISLSIGYVYPIYFRYSVILSGLAVLLWCTLMIGYALVMAIYNEKQNKKFRKSLKEKDGVFLGNREVLIVNIEGDTITITTTVNRKEISRR